MTGSPVRPVKRARAHRGSLRVLSAFGLGSNQWVLDQRRSSETLVRVIST